MNSRIAGIVAALLCVASVLWAQDFGPGMVTDTGGNQYDLMFRHHTPKPTPTMSPTPTPTATPTPVTAYPLPTLINPTTIAPGTTVGSYVVDGVGASDDTLPIYTALQKGDIFIKLGRYRINGFDYNVAPDGRQTGGIPIPSYRNIRCERGAVLLNPHTPSGSTWQPYHSNVFRVTGPNHGISIIGCDFAGTNTASVAGYNAAQEFDQGVMIELNASYVEVAGNDFSYFWGNAGFQTYQPSSAFAPHHINFLYNTGSQDGIYSWCDDGATDSYFGHNHSWNSAGGTELDNAQQISQRNVYEYNINETNSNLRYTPGTATALSTSAGYFGAGQITGPDYSSDLIRYNTVTGPMSFFYQNHDPNTAHRPVSYSNQCTNGCAWR
jgi:hypothetical protein